MTEPSSPENAVAREIDDALDAFLYAKPEEKSKARAKVHAVLWENKAGIVAGLRIHTQCVRCADLTEWIVMAENRLECADCPACVDVARSYLQEALALTSPGCGEVDPTRPACGQGDEWGRKPTDEGYGHD